MISVVSFRPLDFVGIGRTLGICNLVASRGISTSSICAKKQSGRFRVSVKQNNPITYEEANKPHQIGHTKAWNSYNTESHLEFGLRKSETTMEDIFIRRFLTGTWHNLFVSEIIIKRQHNLIRVAGIVQRAITPRKMYFLIGYTEEMLSYWIQSPVKLELQTVDDKRDVIFKYV